MARGDGRLILHQFIDANELAENLAARVCETLVDSINKRGIAMLALSGGSTPKKFFAALSTKQIPWQHVIITLVDERWVDEKDPRSNARLVKELLFTGGVGKAQFVPLFVQDMNIDQATLQLENKLQTLPFPFDAVILGMGTDAHTASFFPGGDNLANALDPGSKSLVSTMRAPDAGEPRITFNLAPLIAAGFLALHIEGKKKMNVFELAKSTTKPDTMPIRHIIDNAEHIEIFWAP